jgi:steroid delta-isomerase-like uncharacterized protein
MSLETNRQVMDGYLKALVGGGDFARFFADDVIWETPETGDRLVGREAVRDFIVRFHREIFDARPEVKHLVVAEDAALLEADFVGTHTGEFAGIPATGAMVRIPYCVAYDLSGGKVVALRGYLPVAAMINQLRTHQAAPAQG